MIAHISIHTIDKFCRVTSKFFHQLGWPLPEWDPTSQVMTAPARLEAVIASLTTATREKVGQVQVQYRDASDGIVSDLDDVVEETVLSL